MHPWRPIQHLCVCGCYIHLCVWKLRILEPVGIAVAEVDESLFIWESVTRSLEQSKRGIVDMVAASSKPWTSITCLGFENPTYIKQSFVRSGQKII
jgi:hypothetical protein